MGTYRVNNIILHNFFIRNLNLLLYNSYYRLLPVLYKITIQLSKSILENN